MGLPTTLNAQEAMDLVMDNFGDVPGHVNTVWQVVTLCCFDFWQRCDFCHGLQCMSCRNQIPRYQMPSVWRQDPRKPLQEHVCTGCGPQDEEPS